MKKIIYILFTLLVAQMVQAQVESVEQYILKPDCPTIPVIGTEIFINIKKPPPVIVMTDTDGDGVLDENELPGDCDNDGIDNVYDPDSDNDGLEDGQDWCPCAPGPIDQQGCPSAIIDRNVFWLHGYQGNETSFTLVADDVQSRFKVNSRRPDYNASQQTLEVSALNVEVDINSVINGQTNTQKNFIIAHSMGGLVGRTLGPLEEPSTGTPLYNGFITLGTPHQGAAAANTLIENPQIIDDALTEACQKLGVGPFKEGIHNSGALGSLAVMFGFGGGILNTACEAGVDIGFPTVLSFAEQGVEAELTTTAAASIPDMPTDHKAVFYGVEDGRDDGSLTPRFIGALTNSPSSFDLYGADASDALGIAEVASQLDFYVSKMNSWYALHDQLCGNSWFCWSSAEPVGDAYKKGVDWFPTLDPTWQELIGARETNLVQSGCEYYYEDWYYGQCEIYVGYDSDCDPDFSYDCEYPRYVLQTTRKDSDGFILSESAMDGPGMNYEAQFMDGSNHMQMKNDSNIEEAVKKIFEQSFDQFQNGYFYTEFR